MIHSFSILRFSSRTLLCYPTPLFYFEFSIRIIFLLFFLLTSHLFSFTFNDLVFVVSPPFLFLSPPTLLPRLSPVVTDGCSAVVRWGSGQCTRRPITGHPINNHLFSSLPASAFFCFVFCFFSSFIHSLFNLLRHFHFTEAADQFIYLNHLLLLIMSIHNTNWTLDKKHMSTFGRPDPRYLFLYVALLDHVNSSPFEKSFHETKCTYFDFFYWIT